MERTAKMASMLVRWCPSEVAIAAMRISMATAATLGTEEMKAVVSLDAP